MAQQPDHTLVYLRQVQKTYDPDTDHPFVALRGLDLAVSSGEFVSIVGKSGSGKSTLINMITGIDRPTAGEVWIAGAAVHRLTEEQIALWRGRAVGVIFQFFQLLPTLTAVENVILPMDYSGKYGRRERAERAMSLLEQVDMSRYAHHLPAMLSGGQAQRVAIARALANDPPLLVADEPTGNLDSQSAAQILALFGNLVAQGKTVLMVTHDDELAQRAHRVVGIADGQIVRDIQADSQRPGREQDGGLP